MTTNLPKKVAGDVGETGRRRERWRGNVNVGMDEIEEQDVQA